MIFGQYRESPNKGDGMKKYITATVIAGLAAGSAFAGANLTMDVATAHVFRGATVVDSIVVQPNLELSGFGIPEEYGSLALGAWGSTAPFDDSTPSFDSIYETDWYLAYTLPQLVEGLDLYAKYTQYQYSFALDEKELGFGAGYELGGFMLGGSANFMIDDRNFATEDQVYFDFTADYGLDLSEEVEVVVGGLLSYMIQGDGNDILLSNGFNHYELYVAADYALGEMWSIDGSLAYIGQLDSDVLSNAAHDVGLLARIGFSCDL